MPDSVRNNLKVLASQMIFIQQDAITSDLIDDEHVSFVPIEF